MEKDERDTLDYALKRVNKALDQRFEKDAALYISRGEVEKIKEYLQRGHIAAIADLLNAGEHSPEIMTTVVIHNAWLLPAEYDLKRLQKIVAMCDPAWLEKLMVNDIFSNSCDISRDFRNMLIAVYLEKIDSEQAEKILKSGADFMHNGKLQAICLKSSLRGLPPNEKYDRFMRYVCDHQKIFNSGSRLEDWFTPEDMGEEVVERIFYDIFFTDHDNREIYTYWRKVFPRLYGPEHFYNRVVKYIKVHSNAYPTCNDLLNKILPTAWASPEQFMAFLQIMPEGYAVLDIRFRDQLAEKAVNSIGSHNQDGWERQLVAALKQAGINIEARIIENLSLDDFAKELLEILNEDRAVPFSLLTRFDKQYRRTRHESLVELRRKMEDDYAFYQFCFKIATHYNRIWDYTAYLVQNFADDIDDNGDALILLDKIEQGNMLTCINGHNFMPLQKIIAEFVRTRDFERFKRCTS